MSRVTEPASGSRLLNNESACAKSLQLSRSAKHGATQPRGWGPAAIDEGPSPARKPDLGRRICNRLLAAKLCGCFDWGESGGGGVPTALIKGKRLSERSR